jgi:2-(1,2-epoxy-1,2-dihydrophenyl)acetyl-CoA isomerase
VKTNLLQVLDGGLLTITLNRPEHRNALNLEVTRPLVEAAEYAAADSRVRAVLLKGAGGTFCVGRDIRRLAGQAAAPPSFDEKKAEMRQITQAARTLHEMPKPVVAAIDGAAAGAGLSLALACDLRVVGEHEKITTAYARVGLSGDFGGSYFLTQIVGSARARELYMTAPVLSGSEAYAAGIMTQVVTDQEVQGVAINLARSLADGPTAALGMMKKNINAVESGHFDAFLEGELDHFCQCLQTSDHREAVAAFLHKRIPSFEGR